MKKIIAFFVNIWVFLFGKRVKENVIEKPKPIFAPRKGGPITAAHNNRKPTKGRHVQYVNMGPNGVSRAIYHGAK